MTRHPSGSPSSPGPRAFTGGTDGRERESEGGQDAIPGRYQEELERLERVAHLLDSQFRLPGTDWRFGLDGLAGLIPGLGDLVSALPPLYFLHVARQTGAGRGTQLRIVGNTLVDVIVGAIPLLGDIFDFGFKSHRRNAALVRKHLQKMGARTAESPSDR